MNDVGKIMVSAAEARGARKLLSALKRKRLVPKAVRLEGQRRNPTYASFMRQGRKRKKKAKPPRRRNVAAGFYDEDGIFHPIRASYDYNRARTHEGRPKTAKGRADLAARQRKRKAATMKVRVRSRKKNPLRLTKKQAFLRRMHLGKLRARRNRARR